MRAGAPLLAGRGLAILGAALVGITAILLSAWISNDLVRIAIVFALYAIGVAVNGRRTDFDHPLTRALGEQLRSGIGASANFLAAYLTGPLIISIFLQDPADPPPAPLLVVLIFGFPLIALVRLAVRDLDVAPVGAIGAGIVVPTMLVALLAGGGAGPTAVGVVTLVVAAAALPFALLLPAGSRWAEASTVLGALFASFAVGAGAAGLAPLTGSTSGATAQSARDAPPPPFPPLPVLAIGLALALVYLLVALSRRRLAGTIVAGSVFAIPPTALVVARFDPFSGGPRAVPAGPLAVLLAVPVIVVLGAVAVLASKSLAAWADARWAIGRAAPVAAIGVALAVAAQLVVLFDWGPRVQGVVVAALLAVGAVLAGAVRGTPGALLAGVVLVGLALTRPWVRILDPRHPAALDPGDLVGNGVVGVLVIGVVAAVLLCQHPRPGVFAAAAYAVAAVLPPVLLPVFDSEQLFGSDEKAQFAWLVVTVGPLLLLGIAASVAALWGRGVAIAAGQAVGTVVLAAGGFLDLTLAVRPRSEAAAFALAPLAPTGSNFELPSDHLPFNGWLMLVIALPLLVSLARRRSAPLSATGLLVVVGATTIGLLGAADGWPSATVDHLAIGVAGAAVVTVAIAAVLLARPAPDVIAPDPELPVSDTVG